MAGANPVSSKSARAGSPAFVVRRHNWTDRALVAAF
jgi:hypothetical protein